MPNDPAGSFPPPPTDNQPPAETRSTAVLSPDSQSGTPPEIKLTDEVAPDLSTPQTSYAGGQAAPPTVEAIPQPALRSEPTPVAPEPSYQLPAAPMPATMPASVSRPFPIVTILLLLISIGAIAATYFFYQQSQNLNTQLSEITKTLEQQKIKENQITITPTPSPTEMPTSTVSASPTPTISPTGSGPVFGGIADVMSLAQKQYPTSQLILIKVTGAENPSLTLIKYWFRKTPDTKTYFYVQKEPGKDPVVVDLGGRVSPDDNIPSLNQLVQTAKLGIDLDTALLIATSVCPTNFDCVSTPATAQYIKISSTIWQISYNPSNGGKSFVVQIDSTTSRINFKSM